MTDEFIKRISLQSGWCIFFALMVLTLPMKLLAAWFLATASHELAHLLCLILCKVPVENISFGFTGIRITTGKMCSVTEILCALAGPVGGGLLVFAFRYWPALAIFSGIQTAFNLLPIYPLDGGRILMCVVSNFKNQRCAKFVQTIVIYMAFILVFTMAVAAITMGFGLIPFAVAVMLLFRYARNIPCKHDEMIVQ